MITLLLLALSGASLTFAYAPFSIWPLGLLATAFALRKIAASKANRFKLAWFFGLGWFGAGISWVHVSIADFGGLPIVASIGLMLLLCGYLALYPALAIWLSLRLFPTKLLPLSLPFFWLLMEWLRSWLLSGFPWLSLGYSQLASPLSGWAPIIGETGLSLLIIVLASMLAVISRVQQCLPALLAICIAYGSGWLAKQHSWVTLNDTHSIAMIQGNIPQSLRWMPEQDEPTMQRYLDLTEPFWQSDLVIWPEAAIPKLELLSFDYLTRVDARAISANTALITGIVNYNWESNEAWNNLIVLGKNEIEQDTAAYRYFHGNRYAKHHLLPIGEFVPFEDFLRPLAPLFDLPMSSFSRGDFQQANLVANGIKLAPAICFEIAFPRQVSANIYHDTDMIITVSNDAWFGRSHGPAQHLEIARMRALEFGRPVVRATNNGITAFVNHKGEVIAELPQFEAAGIQAPVQSTRGITPYHKFGDLLPWLIACILLTFGIRLRSKGRRIFS